LIAKNIHAYANTRNIAGKSIFVGTAISINVSNAVARDIPIRNIRAKSQVGNLLNNFVITYLF